MANTVTEYIQPTYSTDTNSAIAGGIQGMLGDNGYLNSVMGNWYGQAPNQGALGSSVVGYQTQAPTNWQTGAAVGTNVGPGNVTYDPTRMGQFSLGNTNYDGTSAAPFQANTGYNTQTANQNFIGNTTYDPSRTKGFLNEYASSVNDELARISNQNLTEKIMPEVNSTFTGAGQFGSTRNEDFLNRAIRDQNYSLMGQQSKNLMDAQNQAQQLNKDWTQMGVNALNSGNQNYANWTQMGANALNAGNQAYTDWTKMGLNAQDLATDNYGNWAKMDVDAANNMVTNSQNWARIGNDSAQVTNTGVSQANVALYNWANLLNTAGQQDFNNWLTRANYPIGALSQLASAANSIESGNPLATISGAADTTDIENWMTALGAANTAANDGSLDWLASLWS